MRALARKLSGSRPTDGSSIANESSPQVSNSVEERSETGHALVDPVSGTVLSAEEQEQPPEIMDPAQQPDLLRLGEP